MLELISHYCYVDVGPTLHENHRICMVDLSNILAMALKVCQLCYFSALQTHYICDFRAMEMIHSHVMVDSAISLWKEMILWKFVYVAQDQKETGLKQM